MSERKPAEVFHPSEYIREEMEARGWTLHDLACRMTVSDLELNEFALELYFSVGPDDPNCHIGEDADKRLARAFGVSAVLGSRSEASLVYVKHAFGQL